MIALRVLGADRTVANLARIERGLPSAIERGVARASIETHARLKAAMSGVGTSDAFLGKRGATPPRLGVRTGLTRARLTPGGRVFRRGRDVFSAVGSPDGYVAFHETGGTIQGAPYLRIPLAAAQTAGGQDRNLGRSVRGLPGLFVVRSRAGNLFIAERGSARGDLRMLYLLVRGVRLPARGTFAAVREGMRPRALELVGGQVSLEVRRANNG